MTLNPTCPHCSSSKTSFKSKAKLWECDDCEQRFTKSHLNVEAQFEAQTIFLSYAHKSEREEDYDLSEELVWLIKDELEKDGHHVWIDQERIASGTQWRERITTAILSHTHFLSFLSKRSVRDPGVCLNEIAIALGSGRQIQTLLTESEESVRQPLTISHLQWHEFSDWKAIKEGHKKGPKGEAWDVWFSERMALIRSNLFDVQRIKVAGDLQRLKDILEPRTFEADIVSKIEGFFGRRWLFEACDHWLNQTTHRLFWLKGSPGIGKSCFAAKLVHQSNSAIVGFFKCEFQSSKSPEDSASECIRTLAYQLAARLPDYRMKLLYQQQLDKDKVQKKTADDLFSYLITEPLNVSGKIPEAIRLALVIDALDEAGRNDGYNALADLIHKHADKLPPWLGIIVTSRPEPYLQQQLGSFEATSIEGGTEQNLQDLRDYLNQKLDVSIAAAQRNTIIDQIIDKSGGTFLYLKLIEKDETLDLAKPETLPAGIDDVFMRDFKRYYPNVKEYGQDAEPFLRLMASALGPLPKNLAKDLLGWSNRDITTKVVQPLGSLLQDKGDGVVFFHKSLSDWLQDSKRSGNYQVNDTGARELGNFLWNEYKQYERSQWRSQVVEWLATLLPSTEHWNDLDGLDQFAEFLEEQSKFRSAIVVRERYVDKALNTFGDDHEFVARAYFKSGVLFGNALEFTSSQMYLLKSQKIQMKRTPFDEGFYADTLDALGIVAGGVEARLDDSVNYFEQSIKIKEVCASVHPSSHAKTLNFLAIVKDAKGEFKTANELYEKAISIFQRHGVSNASDFATLLNNYSIVKLRENGGLVFGKSNPFNSAKLEFKRAKDIMAGAYQVFLALSATNSSPSLAIVLNNLGIAYHNLNDKEMAAESFLKSHHICVELLGEKHPDVATALNNQAALLSCFHHDDEALSLYWQSFRIYKEALGANHPHVARCLNNLGVLEHERDNLGEARRLYDMAYEIYLSTLGDGHCDTAQIQNNLALLEIQAGHLQSGSTLLKKVLDARIKSLGAMHPQVGNSYIHLSRALSVQHEYAESNAYLMKGINLIQQWVDSQDCIRHLNDERLALAHKGQLVQADVLCYAEDISTRYDQDIHEHDFAKFLDAYIDSLTNLQSRNKNQLKSVSGSFLRMQLEVLDIGFANPISTQIVKSM